MLRGLMDMFTVMYPQIQNIDFRRDARTLKVPVYILDGTSELSPRRGLTLKWFAALRAPSKRLIRFENAAHSVAFEQFEKFGVLMLETVLPQTYASPRGTVSARGSEGSSEGASLREDSMNRRKTTKAKTKNRFTFGVGFFISIGAGVGVVAGTLLGDLVSGMVYGAGAGVVVGAAVETYRRQPAPPAPLHTAQPPRPTGLRWLIGCLVFLGVSALFGGVVLVGSPSGEWLHIPLSVLRYSPFNDFLIPGLILGTVFGLGSLLTVLALWIRPVWPLSTALTRFTGEYWAWSAAVALGLGQLIWIVTQMLMVRGVDALQVVYGTLGMLIVVLACLPGVRRYFALRPVLILSRRPR